MAKFISPTFGYISGRHGSAVAAITKNGNVLRLHKAPSNPNTPKQQAQRLKFGLVNQSLASLTGILKKGYLSSEALRPAVSHALKNAVEGELPDFTLNWAKVQVAMGTLPPVHTASAVVNSSEGTVSATWDSTLAFQASDEDSVNLVFFNEDAKLSLLYENVASRKDGTAVQLLPDVWKGCVAHCWLYLSAKDRNVNSVSVYVGLLQL